MSDGEDANNRGEIDERDRIWETPGSGATKISASAVLARMR